MDEEIIQVVGEYIQNLYHLEVSSMIVTLGEDLPNSEFKSAVYSLGFGQYKRSLVFVEELESLAANADSVSKRIIFSRMRRDILESLQEVGTNLESIVLVDNPQLIHNEQLL
jgi:hypothetical protein